MTTLSDSAVAGLLLTAIAYQSALGLPAPTPSEVLRATSAPKTTAYKVKNALEELLPGILRPPGRPPAPAPTAPSDTQAVHEAVIAFLMANPGAVTLTTTRRRYAATYHAFVLELCEANPLLELEVFARAVGVPLGTLKDWLRDERVDVGPAGPAAGPPEVDPAPARIETVLAEWSRWKGGFRSFCDHISFHLRLPFSRQHISDILEAHGVRIPQGRGRPPDASALREGFETFFPGAQWVGDGKVVEVHILGERHLVNLELNVDAHSGAFVGASLRPTEDSAAVVEAFQDGVATTGAPPLALLLDNKPSNHTEEVDAGLGDTLRMRSRPFVPTDKPHVEGAFGLFAQEAPRLALTHSSPCELALQLATLVVTTWARAVNHRPRADRGKKSRALIYTSAKPTPEEIALARKALDERHARQEKARETRTRRQDPIVRATLDEAFQRLQLDDPDGHLRAAIASWPLSAVVAGIAVFEGKRRAGTLPEGADARYLRGIVKNIAEEEEGWCIAEALLNGRLRARDEMLSHLQHRQARAEEDASDRESQIKRYIDEAMGSRRGIDRTFWLMATADIIRVEPEGDHGALTRLAARRVQGTSAVPHAERLAATRFLFAKVVPLD